MASTKNAIKTVVKNSKNVARHMDNPYKVTGKHKKGDIKNEAHRVKHTLWR